MPLNQEPISVPVGRSARGPEPPDNPPPALPPSADPQAGSLLGDRLTPPIDIYEGPEGLILEGDLPGVPEQNVSIRLEDNVLNLRGRVASNVPDGARTLHEEYRPGDFARSFILSDEVDRSRISASLRYGVLRISLPRAERGRARKIEIKTS